MHEIKILRDKDGLTEEAFKWIRPQESSVRTTGISVNLDGNSYIFLGLKK